MRGKQKCRFTCKLYEEKNPEIFEAMKSLNLKQQKTIVYELITLDTDALVLRH